MEFSKRVCEEIEKQLNQKWPEIDLDEYRKNFCFP